MNSPATKARRLPLDYDLTLDCIHCGLCLNSCPTYRESGRESESPRGRIHLMRALGEGRLEADTDCVQALDSCLVCRNCETVCPAGVQFGALMESARNQLPAPGLVPGFLRWLGFRVVLPNRRVLALLAGGVRLAQILHLPRLMAPLLGSRGATLASLPVFPPASQRRSLPNISPSTNESLETVTMLEGCIQRQLYGAVNRATVQTLNALGADVLTPADHACCGALHAHNGDLEEARRLAQETIQAFETVDGEHTLPIVVNSAGCGAHMAEYPRLFADDPDWLARANAFSQRVTDFSKFVAQPDRARRLQAQFKAGPARKLAWDDPCHLCHGQGVSAEPRELLDLIPGVKRVELASSQSCCGSAGIHALLHPEESNALLDAKIEEFQASGAELLITANPGCQMHWQAGFQRANLKIQTQHLAETIADSLGRESPGGSPTSAPTKS
ncbi:MAG TPA: (Fe-S)-binding protein [Planctomycetes bacterium]|nr:(Fe-S)-binding protein [Planctomycetota bacterium]HIL38127.1 (Fe-S)-binding protein [Planctomycetota bacterium]